MIREATLGEFVARRSRGIVPNATPDTSFELYSVPAFDAKKPDIVPGSAIGSNKQIVEPGTVLLCKINPRINRAWTVGSFTRQQKIASTEWITFPPHPDVEPRYLTYYLSQNKIRDYLASKASGVGGSLMRVKPSTVEDLPVQLPEVDEQRFIVAEIEKQFSRLDEAVAGLMRVTANLKRYRARVFQAAVEGHLVSTEAELSRRKGRDYETGDQLLSHIKKERCAVWEKRNAGARKKKYLEPMPSDKSVIPQLPEGWTWATWDQIGLSQNGRAFPSADYSEAGVKLLRPGNLHEGGRLLWTSQNTRHMPKQYEQQNADLIVRGGELVMNLTAQSLKDEFLGRVCLTDVNEHCLLNQRLARLTPVLVLPEFALVVFKSTSFRRFVDGLNTGSLIQHMFTSQLARFPVPLPPLAEQRRIVLEVNRKMSITEDIETQLTRNKTRGQFMRQVILARAFGASVAA